MEKLDSIRTGEEGFDFVTEQDALVARFDVGGASPTGALEMMRGNLTEVLYETADELQNVTYHFETTIRALRQVDEKVSVDLEARKDGKTWTEDFDLMVGADGVKSRTRSLAMGSPEDLNCYKAVGAVGAYFSINKAEMVKGTTSTLKVSEVVEHRQLILQPPRRPQDGSGNFPATASGTKVLAL